MGRCESRQDFRTGESPKLLAFVATPANNENMQKFSLHPRGFAYFMVSLTSECRANRWTWSMLNPASKSWLTYVFRKAWKHRLATSVLKGRPADFGNRRIRFPNRFSGGVVPAS